MAIWKIAPQYKKSFIQYTYYKKDEFWITQEIGWRWGEIEVTTPDDVNLQELLKDKDKLDVYEDLSDYNVEIGDLDDGCWEEWDLEDVDEDEVEAFQEAWDENEEEGIEEIGWVCDDTDYVMNGPFEITLLNSENNE